jgi:hypothetical protein
VSPAVFISRQAVLSRTQRATFRAWTSALACRAAVLRALPRDEYRSDPWPLLLERLGAVHGVVVFGFCPASPWTQIEAGLAIALGLPVLALPERGVSEGVFDPTTWGPQLMGHDLADVPDAVVLDAFLAACVVGLDGATLAAV